MQQQAMGSSADCLCNPDNSIYSGVSCAIPSDSNNFVDGRASELFLTARFGNFAFRPLPSRDAPRQESFHARTEDYELYTYPLCRAGARLMIDRQSP